MNSVLDRNEWANRRNWYALYVCICSPRSIHASLDAMGVRRVSSLKNSTKSCRKHKPETINEVVRLRADGLTYKAIAEAVNLSPNSVAHIIRQAKIDGGETND